MTKEERKIYSKEYYQKNKEKNLKQSKDYTKSHKDFFINYAKKYYKDNYEHFKLYRKEYYIKNEDKLRDIRFKKTYGITLKEYNDLFLKQNGKCLICEKHQDEFDKSLFIDHDHKNGNIRGLLCYRCNLGISLFNDDKKLLERAIMYLK